MKQNNIFTLLMALCLIILVWIALSSCSTYNRGYRKITKGHLISPKASAYFCAVTYPPVSRVDSFVEYREGEIFYTVDSVMVDCDTVKVKGDTRVIKLPCPPCPHKTDTLYIRTNKTTVNTAELKTATSERDNYKAEATKFKNRANGYFWWAVIASGLIAIWLVIKIISWKARAVKATPPISYVLFSLCALLFVLSFLFGRLAIKEVDTL